MPQQILTHNSVIFLSCEFNIEVICLHYLHMRLFLSESDRVVLKAVVYQYYLWLPLQNGLEFLQRLCWCLQQYREGGQPEIAQQDKYLYTQIKRNSIGRLGLYCNILLVRFAAWSAKSIYKYSCLNYATVFNLFFILWTNWLNAFWGQL